MHGVYEFLIAFLIPFKSAWVNFKKSYSFLYIFTAITIGIRVIGPALGFLLGALCTKVYVNPLESPPDYDASDPRWVGAWWLGKLDLLLYLCTLYKLWKPILTLFGCLKTSFTVSVFISRYWELKRPKRQQLHAQNCKVSWASEN